LAVCTVTVYPEANSPYVSQLYAGLTDLRANGTLELRFGRRKQRSGGPTDVQGMLWMEVASSGQEPPVKVCFDTFDWPEIASMDDLLEADIYFKRSYHAAYLGTLTNELQDKIAPMGLHYGCTSRNESFLLDLRMVFARNLNNHAFNRNPIRASLQLVGAPCKALLNRHGFATFPNLPPFVDDFEVAPNEPAEPRIFYRTRVYSPDEAPYTFRAGRLDEFNGMRVNTIRALKAHFGERFIGGLRPSRYAEKIYPDCMFPNDPGLRGHLDLSKACLVNINTAGLHDSTSWKIPEYMAGSRCIVSEPMKYETSVPLIEDKHYLGFHTPEECVAACAKLFDDPAMASAMRRANFSYYAEHIRPDRMMSRCLRTVVEWRGKPLDGVLEVLQ